MDNNVADRPISAAAGSPSAAMLELFERPDDDKFYKAVQAVAESGDWPDLAPFREAVLAADSVRRRRGVYVMAHHAVDPGVPDLLREALGASETVVQTAVLTAVGRHRLVDLLPDVCRIFLVEGNDPQLAKAAAETLGKLSDLRAVEPLRQAKERFPTFVVRSACDMALRRLAAVTK
ncbi:MAG: hypothetical protein VKO21_10305 [Candidatus Sericytochromatia bacterium]|nr:hypothetical protein [Candidatus Sericytochromatia bacterium]